MKKFLLVLFQCLICSKFFTQIQNGPMIGYVHQKEVALWVQTESSQKVQFAYRIAGSQKKWRVTPTQQTNEALAFTSKAVLQNLNPGRSYEYRVILDNQTQTPFGSQVFKTQEKLSSKKQAIDLSFAIGSCTYINE
ncbi:MAG: hypothetical protein RLZZ38_1346, partial [Bacteroidota bacterium]